MLTVTQILVLTVTIFLSNPANPHGSGGTVLFWEKEALRGSGAVSWRGIKGYQTHFQFGLISARIVLPDRFIPR
jgi:hypothetical protein